MEALKSNTRRYKIRSDLTEWRLALLSTGGIGKFISPVSVFKDNNKLTYDSYILRYNGI